MLIAHDWDADGFNEFTDADVNPMRSIRLKGFTIKNGKVVRNQYRLSVSERLRQAGSKRIKVARKGQA